VTADTCAIAARLCILRVRWCLLVNGSLQQLTKPPQIGAAVLAAGSSTRLGFPKQLVVRYGEPLVRRAARNALAVGASPVVVVLGANADLIAPALSGLSVTSVVNHDWRIGLSSSLAVALRAVINHPSCDGVLVTLVDQPQVDVYALRGLVDRFDGTHRIVASEYNGIIGVPALFGREFVDDLSQLIGDAGAGGWLRSRRHAVTCVPLTAAAFDIDTASDLTHGALVSHQSRA
jgi:molybdenum cofactor cytidylyltransferase